MANKILPNVCIDKAHFVNVLKQHNVSIQELGRAPSIDRTDKTIRRYLEKGEMPYFLLERIAMYLDIPCEDLVHKNTGKQIRCKKFYRLVVSDTSLPDFDFNYGRVSDDSGYEFVADLDSWKHMKEICEMILRQFAE